MSFLLFIIFMYIISTILFNSTIGEYVLGVLFIILGLLFTPIGLGFIFFSLMEMK